jgi:hypothetical protein
MSKSNTYKMNLTTQVILCSNVMLIFVKYACFVNHVNGMLTKSKGFPNSIRFKVFSALKISKECGLLGYGIVYCSRTLPTFRRYLLLQDEVCRFLRNTGNHLPDGMKS